MRRGFDGVGTVSGECDEPAVEQDSEKLHELIKEINRQLAEKAARLKGNPPKPET
jgi:hypothetical protein